MTQVSHSKAPISEIIFGLTFNFRKFDDQTIFKIQQLFSEEYTIIQYLNPLTDESLNEYDDSISLETNSNSTGTILFRLRNETNSKLIQIQGNKIYFNWVRLDSQDPDGIYPGFDANYNEFENILKEIQKKTSIDLFDNIKYCELTYHDRIIVDKYVKDFNSIQNLLNINFFGGFDQTTKNISLTQSFTLPNNSSYGIININSLFSNNIGKKVLGIEVNVKGITEDVKSWFYETRQKQNEIFKSIINNNVLKTWV